MLQRYHPMIRVNVTQLTIESNSDINQLLVRMRSNNGFFNKILGQNKNVNSFIIPVTPIINYNTIKYNTPNYNTTNHKLSKSMNNSLLQYFK